MAEGAGSGTEGNCKNLNKAGMPESACQQSLDSMKKAAEAQGISCD